MSRPASDRSVEGHHSVSHQSRRVQGIDRLYNGIINARPICSRGWCARLVGAGKTGSWVDVSGCREMARTCRIRLRPSRRPSRRSRRSRRPRARSRCRSQSSSRRRRRRPWPWPSCRPSWGCVPSSSGAGVQVWLRRSRAGSVRGVGACEDARRRWVEPGAAAVRRQNARRSEQRRGFCRTATEIAHMIIKIEMRNCGVFNHKRVTIL